MAQNQHLTQLLKSFHSHQPLRSGSLVITIFGDVVAPHGGEIWLGSLIKLLNILGLNDRLVRTTVSRLAKKDWLEPVQIGRKSYYHLTNYGIRSFVSASSRIYSGSGQIWDGKWRMVILPSYLKDKNLKAQKDQLIKELKWLSFGRVSNNVFIHSNPDFNMVTPIINRLGLEEEVIIVNDASLEYTSQNAGISLVKKCWVLDDLSQQYKSFINEYEPVFEMLMRENSLSPEEALAVRILMINQYRKISLQDPALPEVLLPEGWAGTVAHHLCRDIYKKIAKSSEIYIRTNLEAREENLPAAGEDFSLRFGGL